MILIMYKWLMICWTCNYRSCNYTIRSESAGRWEGRKVPQRCRRRSLMWERWRQSPPWSAFILRASQWKICAPSSKWSCSEEVEKEVEKEVELSDCLALSLAGNRLWLIEKTASASSHTSTSFLLNAIKHRHLGAATKYIQSADSIVLVQIIMDTKVSQINQIIKFVDQEKFYFWKYFNFCPSQWPPTVYSISFLSFGDVISMQYHHYRIPGIKTDHKR